MTISKLRIKNIEKVLSGSTRNNLIIVPIKFPTNLSNQARIGLIDDKRKEMEKQGYYPVIIVDADEVKRAKERIKKRLLRSKNDKQATSN